MSGIDVASSRVRHCRADRGWRRHAGRGRALGVGLGQVSRAWELLRGYAAVRGGGGVVRGRHGDPLSPRRAGRRAGEGRQGSGLATLQEPLRLRRSWRGSESGLGARGARRTSQVKPTNKVGVLRKVPWSSLKVPEDVDTRGKTDGWRSNRVARVRYWRKKGGHATEQVVGDVRLGQVAIRTNHAAVPCGVALKR